NSVDLSIRGTILADVDFTLDKISRVVTVDPGSVDAENQLVDGAIVDEYTTSTTQIIEDLITDLPLQIIPQIEVANENILTINENRQSEYVGNGTTMVYVNARGIRKGIALSAQQSSGQTLHVFKDFAEGSLMKH